MATFEVRYHNREQFPTKHLMIVEDDIIHQVELLAHFATIFDRQGNVRISVVSGSVSVASILQYEDIDVIVLDFDLPYGNGSDLIQYLKEQGRQIPIVTASGWPPNNETFSKILTDSNIPFQIHSKENVIKGIADDYIKSFLI